MSVYRRWLVVRSNGDAKVYTRRHFPAWNEAVIPLVINVPVGQVLQELTLTLPDTGLGVEYSGDDIEVGSIEGTQV
jgi:hypothetical protein